MQSEGLSIQPTSPIDTRYACAVRHSRRAYVRHGLKKRELDIDDVNGNADDGGDDEDDDGATIVAVVAHIERGRTVPG